MRFEENGHVKLNEIEAVFIHDILKLITSCEINVFLESPWGKTFIY